MKDWIRELVEIMARLRAKDGCPWDREQTHETLKPYLIEEAYELIDAIDDKDDDMLLDELGDVLLQVVFHSQIASEEERFDLQGVARNVSEKLVRRHPHVFDSAYVKDADGVVRQWEEIKKKEKNSRKRESILDGVPRHLPALGRAQKLQKKAAKYGFDWPEVGGVVEKIEEEVTELKEAVAAGDAANIREEFGDLFFTLVNLSRFMGVDAEDALQECNRKFYQRFTMIEKTLYDEGRAITDCDLNELDQLWDKAKGK